MFKIVATFVCVAMVAVSKVQGVPRPLGQPPILDGPSRLLPAGLNGGGFLPRSADPATGSAVILSKFSENTGDGNFRYGFESSNGIKTEQVGILKGPDPENPEGSQAVQGSYSYISPEGIPITVNYIADENGFRAVGDHIPTNNVHGNNFDISFNSHLRPAAPINNVLAHPEPILRNYNGLRGVPAINHFNQYPYNQAAYPHNYNLGRFAQNPYHHPLIAPQNLHPGAGFAYNRGLGLGGVVGAGFPNRFVL